MNMRSSRTNPSLLSSIGKPERILRQSRDRKSYTTAGGEMFTKDAPARPPNQGSMVEKDRENAAFDAYNDKRHLTSSVER